MASSKQFKASIVLGGVVAGTLKTAFGSAESGVKRIGAAVEALTARQRKLGDVVQTFGHMGRDVDRIRDSYNQVTRQVERLKSAQQRLNRVEQASIRNREKLDTLIGKMPGSHGLGTIASAAGVGAGLRAYEKINDAETDLRVALMDKSGSVPKEFEKIRQTAVGLHNILPGTLADFHNVAVALKENGTSAEVIANGGLVAAAKLGVVMKMPVESAAEMTAKLREAFQLSETELGKMADLSQRAKFGFGLKPDDLLLGAKYYGGKLGSLGLNGADNVKKVYALQGQAAQNGMDGSTFGTNFGTMLSRVGLLNVRMMRHSKIMDNARGILEKYNVDMQFFDKAGKFAGIDNMVAQLSKLQVMSQKERTQVITTLFGEEAGRPAELISRKGSAGYQSALKAMDDQASLQQRIDALTQSFTNKVKALGGSMETAVGMAFEPLGHALLPIMSRMNEIISHGVMPWIEHNQKLIGTITGVVSGLVAMRVATTALRIGGLLLNGGLLSIAKRLIGLQAAAAVAATGVEGAAVSAAAASTGIGSVITGTFGAVLAIGWPVVALIGAVAAAGLALWKYWQPVKAWFIGLGRGIAEEVSPAFGELLDAVAPLEPAFAVLGGWLRNIGGWFTTLLTPMRATNAQLTAATTNGQSFGRLVGAALGGLVVGVSHALKAFVWLGTTIGAAAGWVAVTLPAAWDTLKQKIGSVVDWLMAKIRPLMDGMRWIGKKADDLGVTAAANKVGAGISSAWNRAVGGDRKGGQIKPALSAPLAPVIKTTTPVTASAPGTGATVSAPPNAPRAIASDRSVAASTSAPAGTVIHQQNTFHITQQPGEDSASLARRISAENQRAASVQQRGTLIDGPGA